jgi:prepilin-type N-terminal cleavage/methylation domain-containing protein
MSRALRRGAAGRGATATALQRGFTLIEVLLVLMLLALLFAIVVPNLGTLLPSARLSGSGAEIRRQLDWVRSEARIQAKRMVIEFDLDHAMWRIVYPPEQQLTRDQDASALEERPDDWTRLQTDVVFAGAGDGKAGLTTRGSYKLVIDPHGFTGDQVVVLTLKSDPDLTWSMMVHGLSGRVDVQESDKGEKPLPQVPNEGAF